MQKIKDITDYLETLAPLAYQENYDNCGLLVGDASTEVSKVLITLDCTEAVVDEAIRKGCNLIVAHHPIIFGGLKKLNGKNYVERTVIKAIKNNIAIYAIHTNYDNVLHGVNTKIAERLNLKAIKILSPKKGLLNKLVVFVPISHFEQVQTAIFQAGAGKIGNYSECSFYGEGKGTFKGNDNSNAFVGDKNIQHTESEMRLEVLVEEVKLNTVLTAMLLAHPYEEVAYDIVPIVNANKAVGSGLIGELAESMDEKQFLQFLKDAMQTSVIRYTSLVGRIKKVAVCGGSGSFLLKQAIAAGADAYVTADFKYHEFFDAENKLMIADIGHYESEIFTINLLADEILKKFHTFAVILSETNTNPIKYY
ncbi:MAG: Nif3-like dinuclear metal center hexameric protein [Bacteroidia bacterium]|nr:Nif3-like dinuclear metal center hexameric protein [Bacteroidia bacterium]